MAALLQLFIYTSYPELTASTLPDKTKQLLLLGYDRYYRWRDGCIYVIW